MSTTNTTKTLHKQLTIVNKLGLHARAAAKLVNHASHYLSKIELKKDDKIVNGKSIMGVMMLAASKGTVLDVSICGEDAADAMADLEALFKNRFDEAE